MSKKVDTVETEPADNFEEARERPASPVAEEPPTAPEVEASGDEMRTLEFRGEEFIVLADPDDWTTLCRQSFAHMRTIDGVELLLGPQQWSRLNAKFPKFRDFNALVKIIADEYGFGSAGN